MKPLDFATASYIRVYNDDSAEVDVAGWEARALLWHLQRRMFPSGVFYFGRVRIEDIVFLRTGIPADVTTRALPLLLDAGALVLRGDALVDPWFDASQFDPDRKRRPIPRETRDIVLREHGMVCWLCTGPILDRPDLHLDHVLPKSHGGADTADNLRPAHARCNMSRGNRPADYFRRRIQNEVKS